VKKACSLFAQANSLPAGSFIVLNNSISWKEAKAEALKDYSPTLLL
jgi:hypothetical protein